MTLAEKILELAEKYREDTAENLSRLVRIKSPNTKEEAFSRNSNG